MKEQFERIYARNEWKFGSGEGSLPVYTTEYRKLIESFLQKKQIQTVLDFGCGDWQSSRLIDWGKVQYVGFDIVPQVIADNRAKYQKANLAFELFNGDFNTLPNADLIIVKDVLQHWSEAAIIRFLPVFARYPNALVTNCINPGSTLNPDIPDGGFRPLDLRLPPFNVAADELLIFSKYKTPLHRWLGRAAWTKKVLLIQPVNQ